MNIKAQFGHLFEPSLLSQIEAKAHFAEAKEGEIILRTGDTIRTGPLIISELIKVTRLNENGRELLLYYVGGGSTCAMTIT
jgi:CRP/FNR family transcriptional regulator